MTSLYLTATVPAGLTSAAETTRWLLAGTAGASSRACNKNGAAGPTAPLKITDSALAGTDGNTVAWYSVPLSPVLITGAITCSLWCKESANTANTAPTIGIYRCDALGAELATIVAPTLNLAGTEMATTAGGAAKTISVTAANVTDTQVNAGELLKVALFTDDAADQGGSGSMGSGTNAQFWVNGPTGSAGQSQIAFAETISSAGAGHVFPAVAGRPVNPGREAPVIIDGS